MKYRLLVSAFFVAVLVANSFAGEIHEAIKQGDVEKVKQLAAKDASLLEVKDMDGSTPLDTSALAANLEMVRLLLEMGANINGGTTRTATCFTAPQSRTASRSWTSFSTRA
jgi:ankyrin repeat protein